mgnify:CR=1 FL=1
MPTAYVLVNVDVGKEEQCFKELKNAENVKEIHLLYGFYDLVIIVKADTIKQLNNSLKKIRQNNNVIKTETMPIIE